MSVTGWAKAVACVSLALGLLRYLPPPLAISATLGAGLTAFLCKHALELRRGHLLLCAQDALYAGDVPHAEALSRRALAPWWRHDENRLPLCVIQWLSRQAARLACEGRSEFVECILSRGKAAAEAGGLQNDKVYSELCNLLGSYLSVQGRWQEAIYVLSGALDIQKANILTDPALLINTMTGLAAALMISNVHRAIGLYQEALRLSELHLGIHHSGTAFCSLSLGVACGRGGDYCAAEAAHERAIKIYGRIDANPSERAMAARLAASLYCDYESNLERADELSAAAVAMCDGTVRESGGCCASYLLAARTKLLRGQVEEAAALCEHARQLGQTVIGTFSYRGLDSALMAEIEAERGRDGEATELFRVAVRTAESTDAVSKLNLPFVLCRFAGFLVARGRITEAESVVGHCLTLLDCPEGYSRLEVAEVLHVRGKLFCCTRDWRGAVSCLERAVAIRRQCFGLDHRRTRESEMLLAQAQTQLS